MGSNFWLSSQNLLPNWQQLRESYNCSFCINSTNKDCHEGFSHVFRSQKSFFSLFCLSKPRYMYYWGGDGRWYARKYSRMGDISVYMRIHCTHIAKACEIERVIKIRNRYYLLYHIAHLLSLQKWSWLNIFTRVIIKTFKDGIFPVLMRNDLPCWQIM